MRNVQRELLIRKEEASSLISFVKYLEEEFLPPTEVEYSIVTVKTSLKANIVLMLYNAIESTLTKSLERIHEKIKEKQLKYCDLRKEIKKILAIYYGYSMEKSGNVNSAMEYALQLADFINGDICFNISYKELVQKYPMYSGNLDSREIITVLKRYGIVYEEHCSELKTIKDDRNKLAHGEDSFEEIGRSLSIPQLEEMSYRTFEYLEKMVREIECYLDEEKYRT
jgi:uncharacterized protein YutE (UPF0331/DUF86 family)